LPKYLYDDAGATLFERICELDEYYLTRTESSIHRCHANAIAAAVGPGAWLVEFGSGSGSKTRRMLGTLDSPEGYVPVDICRTQLEQLAATVHHEFPRMKVIPVWADFSSALSLPSVATSSPHTVALYHGSTIGNHHPAQARKFLEHAAAICGPGSAMMVGVDLAKERATVERAYNDSQGVTEAFNLNLLRRINRECGADFDVGAFAHRAIYDERRFRVEMRLISTRCQVVTVPALNPDDAPSHFEFAAGEFITTEYSYKHTQQSFATLARGGGWNVEHVWLDPRRFFSTWFLRRSERESHKW
jgi:dimethylhistidine N-methyltransferase